MNFYSTAGQDRFVHELIVKPEGLTNGQFVDIGCRHPYSNTLGLEEIGWNGILLDIELGAFDLSRKGEIVKGDATTNYWGNRTCQYDYLSLDVDSATLAALKNLPLDTMRFRIITIEHDVYEGGEHVQAQSEMRSILMDAGYHLACGNVCDMINGKSQPFEDWWVIESLLERAKPFACTNWEWEDIFGLPIQKGSDRINHRWPK